MITSTYSYDQWLGIEASTRNGCFVVMIVPVQNAKCVLFLETKFICLTWVKEQLKVMLKAKNIVKDELYAFKVAVSSLCLYLKDLLSHLVHLLHLLVQVQCKGLWVVCNFICKSLNTFIQMGQMDLDLINFWDNVVNKVSVY